MKKILITGVSGTGKSTTAEMLSLRGIPTIDIDSIKGLCHWINTDTAERAHWSSGIGGDFFEKHKYICDKEQLIGLMNEYLDKEAVVVVGLADNQSDFLDLFDKVFLFHCNEETFIKRITERTNHDFGKHDSEKQMILGWYKDFEREMTEKGATPINTEGSIETIVEKIIKEIKS